MVNALFSSEALLVFPHLRIQNANAISSPLTHGFPSITAFTGLMWALERNLAKAKVPLRLHGVGVICHHHQEQTTQGYVRSFNLTRNPVDKDGSTAAIVEEGRIHLDISLVFSVSEIRTADTVPKLLRGNETDTQKWANTAGDVLAQCVSPAAACCLPVPHLAGACVLGWQSWQTTHRSAIGSSANGVGSGCPASRWLDVMICWLTGCVVSASAIRRRPCWTPGSMPRASTMSRYHSRTANPRPPMASSAGRIPGAAPAAAGSCRYRSAMPRYRRCTKQVLF